MGAARVSGACAVGARSCSLVSRGPCVLPRRLGSVTGVLTRTHTPEPRA